MDHNTPKNQRRTFKFGVKRHGLAAVAAAIGVSEGTLLRFLLGQEPQSDIVKRSYQIANHCLRFDLPDIQALDYGDRRSYVVVWHPPMTWAAE